MTNGPLAPVLDTLLQGLRSGVKERRTLLLEKWPAIVGSAFAKHTKAHLHKQGTLSVWVDDSTLAFELSQRYRGTILKRVEELLGEGEVKRIAFRVGEIR